MVAKGGVNELINQFIKDIHNGGTPLNKGLIEYNFKSLLKAISKATGKTIDLDKLEAGLEKRLVENAANFAVFKNHAEGQELAKLLRGKEGNLLTFSEYKKQALPVSELYNKTWLETEYNQAVANAQMAQKWEGFKENEDLYPNLIYRAVQDERSRPEHSALDGVVLPINDPFWDSHFPPNGWGCRCTVDQTDKPVNAPPKGNEPDKGFDFNPGKEGKLFSDSNGYTNGVGEKDRGSLEDEAKKLL